MSEQTAILIIDDSEDDRMFYKRTLQKIAEQRYAVSEAENGMEGIQSLSSGLPACILLDYSLPGHNGIEVLKQVRSQFPFVPVVMLTGQGNEEVAVSAIQEGAQNYIAKANITPESLQRVIESAIERCVLHKRIHEQRASLEIFAHALAHDLKEPVRTIRSFLDVMKAHENFSEKGKVHFDYVQKAAKRMHALIDTVFLYTQLDNAQVSREMCDANTVLEETKQNLSELIRERGAVVTSDNLPEVYANRMQLIQVLQNLIANAIYHAQTTPKIHVSVKEHEGNWQFLVSDNGPGISSELSRKIFEPFRKFSHNKEQGMGMGLAICKKVVESHGGEIRCESELGKGTTFLFTISKPASAAASQSAAQDKATQNGPAKTGELPLANVLLVEDNEADIELARIMLIEEAGLQCKLIVAHDGQEAIAAMHANQEKNESVDLVLLDINMPGMNGFELLEHMQKEEELHRIPVVMCTTSDYGKDVNNAKKLGAKGYITKPAGLEGLKPIIETIPTISLCSRGSGYALLRAA
ncbi:MAG TPA: response regulator [Rickettsiales bacterium]|nr:response regulator [Rickettsiales bacterium]